MPLKEDLYKEINKFIPRKQQQKIDFTKNRTLEHGFLGLLLTEKILIKVIFYFTPDTLLMFPFKLSLTEDVYKEIPRKQQ